jgi:hypothetical protein
MTLPTTSPPVVASPPLVPTGWELAIPYSHFYSSHVVVHIVDLLKKNSHLTGSTLGRRAQTIITWFRWIRNNLGIVEVNKNGDIKISSDPRLV